MRLSSSSASSYANASYALVQLFVCMSKSMLKQTNVASTLRKRCIRKALYGRDIRRLTHCSGHPQLDGQTSTAGDRR